MSSEPSDVRLRPVRETDLQTLERIDTDPRLSEPFEWRGFANPAKRRQRWEHDGYLDPNDSVLIVSLLDDTCAGIVNWRSIASSGPAGVFAIGILLLPDYRGKGYGTSAQHLLVEYLFATTTANRIEATTEIDNLPEQRALEKSGFVREGMLRGRGFVRGEWRDGLMYSRLRNDPPPEVA